MSQLRERWEGVSLPGDYLLQHWESGDDQTGFFEASRHEEGEHFTVKLVAQSDADGSVQLARWRRTQGLEHPNLRRLLDFGRAELDGQIVLYAVMEKADDSLAAALAQNPLSEPEAREVLDATLKALRYLQARGLAVETLDPEHVVAVGETIKVCTHGLKEVPPETPFRHELRHFWDLVSPSPTARRNAILSEALGDLPEPAQITAPAPDPKPTAGSLTPPAADAIPYPPDENPRTAGRTPKWIFVGAAAVALLILGLNLRRAPDTPAQAGSAPPTPVSTTIVPKTTAPNPAAPQSTATRTDAGTKPSPLDPAPRAVPGKAMWRVIAYTYRSQAAAQHKVNQVNRANPELAATVFTPRQKKGYYLVALGGRMTRDDALRLQKKARADRETRGAYIQNYLD